MNPQPIYPPTSPPASPPGSPPNPTVDADLADQARPGHGIPSQDPNPAAQSSPQPAQAQREAQSVLAGGGVIVGAAAGVAIGSAVAGPVGGVVGGTVGAVAGALGGVAAGPMVTDADEPASHESSRQESMADHIKAKPL